MKRILSIRYNQCKISAVILWLLMAAVCSCSKPVDPRLSKAESLMDNNSDSALVILENIRSEELKTEQDNALYSMLLVQAKDKQHKLPVNDSAISVAVDYYKRTEDPLRHTISTYYQGRARYNAANYAMAIVSFIKAREFAIENGYFFWAGMSCRGIADIYNVTRNNNEELMYAKEEYEYLKKSGNKLYSDFALIDLATALGNNDSIEQANMLVKNILDSFEEHSDPGLLYSASRIYALNFIKQKDYRPALRVQRSVCASDFANAEDSLYLALILAECGEPDSAKNFMYKIPESTGALKNLIRYKIARRAADYKTALHETEIIDSIQYKELQSIFRANVANSVSDYFEMRKNWIMRK